MKHKSINLLPDIEEDSSYLRRIKKIAPIIAGTSLIIFLVFYSVSLLYVQQNLREFNRINTEIDQSGKVSLTISAPSIDTLEIFVSEMIKHERISGFNNIIANGIVRDSAGSYSLSVELNVNNRKSLDSALK